MNDYKTIKTAMDSVEVPIEMEQVFEENKMVWDEYAHTPYIDETVQMPGYPVPEEEPDEKPNEEEPDNS